MSVLSSYPAARGADDVRPGFPSLAGRLFMKSAAGAAQGPRVSGQSVEGESIHETEALFQ